MLLFGLADFTVLSSTEKTADGKPKPISGAMIKLSCANFQGQPQELTVMTDADGRGIISGPQMIIPRLPVDGSYEVVAPKGARTHGKVRVGTNYSVQPQEVRLPSN